MFDSSYQVTAIKFLLVGIIITTGTLSVLRPVSLNQNHTAMAQQQQLQQQQLNGNSFQIDNMTFSLQSSVQ